MSLNFTWLSVIVIVILAGSLLYTWHLGRQHKVVDGELDSKLPEAVKANAYTRNPVFLSYGIFFAALLIIIVLVAFFLS
ncbi:MAG: hypothetical protein Q8898_11930 [Bacillota bacterium]|nr:hypothetical protein [Bacillota bacterium]